MLIQELWKYAHSTSVLGLELGDLNGNHQNEIVAFSKEGEVLAFNSKGKILLKDKISEENSLWCAKIFNQDDASKPFLILGGLDGLLRVFNCAPNYTLEANWAQQFGGSISGILVEDVTGDGIPELLAYSIDKTLRVLNPIEGNLIWGQMFEEGIGDVCIWADKENHSYKEVFACGNDGTLRVFNGENGDLLWFKRFTDKIRGVDYINSIDGVVIVCGGDDNLLHFINHKNQEEIKTVQYQDYVWKCRSFPNKSKNWMFISTYSFEYLYDEVPIEELTFTSKAEGYTDDLVTNWHLNSKNIETIEFFVFADKNLIALGTTSGEVLILDGFTGDSLVETKYNSCINSIKFEPESSVLYLCNDAGEIIALSVENI